jgi:hypothetical protein
MSHLWMIISIEIFVVVLILLGIVLAISWRRKKRLTTEIERLLDEVDKTRAERKQWLEQFLTTKHHVVKAQVTELSEQFIEAEKAFLQKFVKQQLEQSSLASTYTQLVALLDQYLMLMPYATPDSIQKPKLAATPAVASPPVPDDEFLEVEDINTNVPIETDESDWNDAFAESEDLPFDHTPVQTLKNKSPSIISEVDDVETDEEETDWNLVFEESDETVNG